MKKRIESYMYWQISNHVKKKDFHIPHIQASLYCQHIYSSIEKEQKNQVCTHATRPRFDLETNLRNQNPEELKLQV
jgi:hypothetical protein